MVEEWKEFAKEFHKVHNGEYYNIWEVSTLGRFKWNGKIVEPHIRNGEAYPIIKNKRIHRIIAETFIPNPENKPCVDHIDGDKLNNRVDNLRWVTHLENNNNPITKQRLINSQNKSDTYKITRPTKGCQTWIKGRRWINNKSDEKLIFESEYNIYKKIGWTYGRC